MNSDRIVPFNRNSDIDILLFCWSSALSPGAGRSTKAPNIDEGSGHHEEDKQKEHAVNNSVKSICAGKNIALWDFFVDYHNSSPNHCFFIFSSVCLIMAISVFANETEYNSIPPRDWSALNESHRYKHTAGMAMNNPDAVVISACAIPAATTRGSPVPERAIEPKAWIIPVIVPAVHEGRNGTHGIERGRYLLTYNLTNLQR